jgi:hypothetical protein
VEPVDSNVAPGTGGVLKGDHVEVRTRYQAGQWAHGYEVAEVLEGGYRVSRRGSQEVLPDVFESADVRLRGKQEAPRFEEATIVQCRVSHAPAGPAPRPTTPGPERLGQLLSQ